jgi:hypothetical protein
MEPVLVQVLVPGSKISQELCRRPVAAAIRPVLVPRAPRPRRYVWKISFAVRATLLMQMSSS